MAKKSSVEEKGEVILSKLDTIGDGVERLQNENAALKKELGRPETEIVETINDMHNESSIRSNSDTYNAGTATKQLIHEEYNSGVNLHTIRRLIADGRARDLNDEPKVGGVPCFIIGSGPSLDDAMPALKLWQGGIICSPSHALSLVYHGIEPTHIVALDPFESWAEVEGYNWSRTRTKLITHPGVWPDLIEKWPNDILLYRQNSGRPDSFYATTQRNMYSERVGDRNKAIFNMLIRTEVTIFACSPPLQLFAADRLGYGVMFLAGCDFGFHSGKSRFTSYTVKTPETVAELGGNAPPVVIPCEWEEHIHPFVPPTPEEIRRNQDKPVMSNNGLHSTKIMNFYKKNMISAWRLLGSSAYTTDHGTITEMPYMDVNKVVLTQGRKGTKRKQEWVHKHADRYLASIGCYVIETADDPVGYNFIESENPEIELNNFMVQMNTKLTCAKCGIEAMPNDGKDHSGDECPNCKEGKLEKKHSVDIDKNMRRVRQLIAWNKNKE
ncbi:MAG: DUF115 domain-containing protein [Deltaproteobacteria bacterium]|nr:DUF115 domain-containing protein [Deltaproteobacteria bacterium]